MLPPHGFSRPSTVTAGRITRARIRHVFGLRVFVSFVPFVVP
jgi:hypothetical protein